MHVAGLLLLASCVAASVFHYLEPDAGADTIIDAWSELHPVDGVYVVLLPLALSIESVSDRVVSNTEGNSHRIIGVTGTDSETILAQFPGAIVSPNKVVTADVVWNLDRIDERLLSSLDNTWDGPSNGGAGIIAYVVDSGITISHVDFGGRATHAFSTFNSHSDVCEHGTHVAGTIGGNTHGVARGVSIRSVKVLDGAGCSGTTLTLASGLMYVLQAAAGQRAVINLSLGFTGSDAVIQNLIAQLIAAGHVVVASAGNEGKTACTHYPSAYPGVVAVAATSRVDASPSWSNYGSCVDIYAPGVDVESADPDGSGYITESGTSMASPHVAGVACLLRQKSLGFSGTQIVSALLGSATPNVVTNTRGSPNLLVYWGTESATGSSVATSASVSSSSSTTTTSTANRFAVATCVVVAAAALLF